MRPSEYTTAGVLLLVSGLMNLLLATMITLWLLVACVGVLWIVPALVGVAELVTGVSMLNGARRPNAMLVAVLGMMAAIVSCNWISLVCEIVVVALMMQPKVTAWLAADDGNGPAEW